MLGTRGHWYAQQPQQRTVQRVCASPSCSAAFAGYAEACARLVDLGAELEAKASNGGGTADGGAAAPASCAPAPAPAARVRPRARRAIYSPRYVYTHDTVLVPVYR